jgi:hypothetical protein
VLGKVKVLPKWLFSVVTGSGRRQGFFWFGSWFGIRSSGFGFVLDFVLVLDFDLYGLVCFGSFSRICSREVAKN